MLRWRIAILISAAIAISYLDRQTLPVAIDAIRKEIPVTDGMFANLNIAFLITYALGLLWTLWRRFDYFLPEQHPRLTTAECAAIAGASDRSAELHSAVSQISNLRAAQKPDAPGNPEPSAESNSAIQQIEKLRYDSDKPPPKIPWLDLLRLREIHGVVLAKFLSDAAWYFYLLWLPRYLYDARGLNIKQVGCFHVIAFGIICLAIPRIEPLNVAAPKLKPAIAERSSP